MPAAKVTKRKKTSTPATTCAKPADVKIFQPAKTAMSSGRGKTKYWVIKPILNSPQLPETLMGWQSGADTRRQIDLKFSSKEEAIAYAEAKQLSYDVIEPKARTPKLKSYAANFTKPVV